MTVPAAMTLLDTAPSPGPPSGAPPLLTGPFRGSRAIAAGLVTRGVLRGPRFRRLFPDVYAPAHLDVDLSLLARAAYLLVEGRGVVAGYAAAELLGASCARPGPPAEVLMFAGLARRSGPHLVVHRDLLGPGEVVRHGDVLLTHAVRVAYDLARWAPDLTEKVVAVDTLAHRRFPIEAVRTPARLWARTAPAGSTGCGGWPIRGRDRRWSPASGWRSCWPGCPLRCCSIP